MVLNNCILWQKNKNRKWIIIIIFASLGDDAHQKQGHLGMVRCKEIDKPCYECEQGTC